MIKLRSLLSFFLVAGFIYGLYAAFYLPTKQKITSYRQQIASLEQDTAALESRIVRLSRSGSAIAFPETMIWSGAEKADAELALQDAIINLSDQSGITLITFGASGLSRDTAQSQISFELEAEGELAQIYNFLATLEQIEPKVAVGTLRMRPSLSYGDPVDDVQVYTQITLWAIWRDEA
jgi:hypothetical protein